MEVAFQLLKSNVYCKQRYSDITPLFDSDIIMSKMRSKKLDYFKHFYAIK